MTPTLENALDRFARDYGTTRTPSASHRLSGYQREALEDMTQALGAGYVEARDLTDARLISLYAIARKSPVAAKRKLDDWLGTPTPAYEYNPAPVPSYAEPYDDSALIRRVGKLESDATGVAHAYSELAAIVQEIRDTTARPVSIALGDAPAITLDTAHPALPRVLRKLRRGESVWLMGPRGSGKSFAAGQLAKVLGVACHVMTGADDQFALIGYFQPHDGSLVRTPFREAWEHGGVICLDELDTYNPQAIICINDALANGNCTFPDGAVAKHPECYVVAGTNTDGRGATSLYSARSVLCGSTRDRFAFIPWGYDPAVEAAMGALNPAWTRYVQAVRAYMDSNSIDEAPSPRATKAGAQAIADGDTWQEAAEAYIWKGLSPDIQARVDRAVRLSDYNTQDIL